MAYDDTATFQQHEVLVVNKNLTLFCSNIEASKTVMMASKHSDQDYSKSEGRPVCLVIGASRGIGRQVAIDLARNGYYGKSTLSRIWSCSAQSSCPRFQVSQGR